MKRTKNVGKLVAVLLPLIMAIVLMPLGTSAQSTFITLHRFSGGSDGGNAQGSLIFDAAGNLYGTTFEGGNSHCGCGGVVFQLTPRSDGRWAETVLHVFGRGNDGAEPRAGLIFDGAGNLLGGAYADITAQQTWRNARVANLNAYDQFMVVATGYDSAVIRQRPDAAKLRQRTLTAKDRDFSIPGKTGKDIRVTRT